MGLKLTNEQLEVLESVFAANRYPSAKDCGDVASAVNLPHHSVRIWFQNRRARMKRASQSRFQTETGKDPSPLLAQFAALGEYAKELQAKLSAEASGTCEMSVSRGKTPSSSTSSSSSGREFHVELKPYPSPILLPLTATGSQSAEAKEKLAALVEGCGEAGVLQQVFECLHSQKTLLMTKIMQGLGLRASVVNSNIDIPDPVSATAIPPGVAGHGAFGGPPPLHPAQKMMFLDHLIGLQTKQNKSLEEEISGLHEILTAQSKVLSTADRPIVARVLNSVSAASASPMSRASSPATTAMC